MGGKIGDPVVQLHPVDKNILVFLNKKPKIEKSLLVDCNGIPMMVSACLYGMVGVVIVEGGRGKYKTYM